MSCLSIDTLSLASARLIRLLSIPTVACFALSVAVATEPQPIKQFHANGIDLDFFDLTSNEWRPLCDCRESLPWRLSLQLQA